MATCCNTALVVQCSVIAYAMSASAAAVTRYQASLRSPHNALHSPSILLYIIDVRRTALILRGGALRVDLLRMLIVETRPIHSQQSEESHASEELAISIELTRLLGYYWLSGKLIAR